MIPEDPRVLEALAAVQETLGRLVQVLPARGTAALKRAAREVAAAERWVRGELRGPRSSRREREAAVTRALRAHGPMTIADLAARLQVCPRYVRLIVADLEAGGALRREHPVDTRGEWAIPRHPPALVHLEAP